MGLVKAASCGLLGNKGQVEAIICVLVDAVRSWWKLTYVG